jgi:molybdopterin/thiamine biosynthesis adenylyltransferase
VYAARKAIVEPVFGQIAPWGIKLCINGHEWAKRQLDKRGIGYEALDNGFLSCAEPKTLQQICDSMGPEQIERLFRKWLKRIPLPLRAEDRQAGYDWNLSIWQMEVSLTQIFDRLCAVGSFSKRSFATTWIWGGPIACSWCSTAS